MSITDELRGYVADKEQFYITSSAATGLLAIADRIDAEHQKAVEELKTKRGDMWLKGYAVCHAELIEGHPVIAADLEKAGWVRLPVDADGEPIHIGDVMDGYGKTIEVVELRYGRSGWVLISRDGNGYADTFAFTHHHVPTVEDVLRGVVELCHNTWKEGSAFESYDVDDVMKSGNIAEYAAKLQLRGDAE